MKRTAHVYSTLRLLCQSSSLGRGVQSFKIIFFLSLGDKGSRGSPWRNIAISALAVLDAGESDILSLAK